MQYPDYRYQVNYIRRLKRWHVHVIGQSLCGRNLVALRRGSGRPRVLIAAGFHGTEYLTVLAALRFARECTCGGSVAIVPCVNPDGTEIAINGFQTAGVYAALAALICDDHRRWQANARGVDINHNFPACWEQVKQRELDMGISSPSCTRFGGYRPESEPETRALTGLCREADFDRVLALHSQGREIYWDFADCVLPEGYALAERMARVSGYVTAQPEPIATGGGFKDWFLQQYRRPGFTVEMGKGQNPLPLSDFEPEYPKVRAILNTFVQCGIRNA